MNQTRFITFVIISIPIFHFIILPSIMLHQAYFNFQWFELNENIIYFPIMVLMVIEFGLFYFSFHKRRGPTKILLGSLKVYSAQRFFIFATIFVLVFTIVIDFIIFQEPLTTLNLDKFPEETMAPSKLKANGIVLTIFLTSSLPMLFTFDRGQFGISYAYLVTRKFQKIDDIKAEHLLRCLETYGKFINNFYFLKINLDNVYGKLLINKFDNLEKKIEKLIEKYDDGKLDPMKYLYEITGENFNEFFVQGDHRPKVEKWLPLVIPIISIAVLFVFNVSDRFVK